ncbi:hypothetical protein AAHB34_11535 [Paenarthrobacter ureafaciens]
MRAIKELADKEEQLSGGGPPTRRQLRLQQLQAEMATSANPIVPAAGSTSAGVAKEGVKGISAPGAPAKPGAATSGTATPAQEKPGLGKPAPEKPGSAPASGKPSPGGDRADAAHTSPAEADMSVEQALAVRELIAAQVQNQTSKLEHIAEQDPLAVDPEVLAQQIALAERAAVLNKRAAAKQRLAEQARQEKSGDQGKPAAAKQSAAKSPTLDSGPSTANNLGHGHPFGIREGSGSGTSGDEAAEYHFRAARDLSQPDDRNQAGARSESPGPCRCIGPRGGCGAERPKAYFRRRIRAGRRAGASVREHGLWA